VSYHHDTEADKLLILRFPGFLLLRLGNTLDGKVPQQSQVQTNKVGWPIREALLRLMLHPKRIIAKNTKATEILYPYNSKRSRRQPKCTD